MTLDMMEEEEEVHYYICWSLRVLCVLWIILSITKSIYNDDGDDDGDGLTNVGDQINAF